MRSIRLEDLPAELRARLEQFEEAGVRALRRAARRGLGVVQRTIAATAPYAPVDSAQYRRGWTVSNVADGAVVFNPVPYAPVIEEGSRPHTPPIGPLLEWARRKLRGRVFVSHTRLRDRKEIKARGQQLLDLREEAAQGLAHGVMWKIRHRGQPGRKVLERSWPEMERGAEKDIVRELARLDQ